MISGDKRQASVAEPPEARVRPGGVPAAASAYLATVILLGLAGLALSAVQVVSENTAGWLGLIGLTVVCSWLAIRIPVPGGEAGLLAITVSDCFVFVAMLVYGPAAAAMTAATDALVTSVRCRLKRPERFAFNITSVTLDAYVVGHLFILLIGSKPPVKELLAPRILAALGVAAVTYFVFNALLLATGMSLAARQTFSRIWTGNFAWASPSVLANLLAALFFTLALNQSTAGKSLVFLVFAICSLVLSALNLLRGRSRLLDGRPAEQL